MQILEFIQNLDRYRVLSLELEKNPYDQDMIDSLAHIERAIVSFVQWANAQKLD